MMERADQRMAHVQKRAEYTRGGGSEFCLNEFSWRTKLEDGSGDPEAIQLFFDGAGKRFCRFAEKYLFELACGELWQRKQGPRVRVPLNEGRVVSASNLAGSGGFHNGVREVNPHGLDADLCRVMLRISDPCRTSPTKGVSGHR